MKYVKILGLAAVAAMALMAFLGASTASATVLCKTTPVTGVCPEGWDYPKETVIHASLEKETSAELWRSNEKNEEIELVDTCTASTVEGITTNTGGSAETVKGPITALTWGEPGTACTRPTTTSVPGSLEVHAIGDTHNGTLTGSGSSVQVETVFGKCTYGTGENLDLGIVTGGSMATIDIDAKVTLVKDDGIGICPKTTRWTAKYTVTNPEPLYVATS